VTILSASRRIGDVLAQERADEAEPADLCGFLRGRPDRRCGSVGVAHDRRWTAQVTDQRQHVLAGGRAAVAGPWCARLAVTALVHACDAVTRFDQLRGEEAERSAGVAHARDT
jgi:hypothetical protein